MRRRILTRSGQWAARHPRTPPTSPKPMDVPIISREAIRKNVARYALDTGCGIEASIAHYADLYNFTEETLREILAFEEGQAS